MTQTEKMRTLVSYFESYKFYHTVKKLPSTAQADPVITADEAQKRMRDIRAFVTSLPAGREKLFLHCHYIVGRSMEKCAEMLGVSSRSIYRIRQRALKLALCHFNREHPRERSAG